MPTGLVETAEIIDGYPSEEVGTQGAGSQATVTDAGTLNADVSVSHLDSFFAQSGWTRDDVLTLAALVQVAAWLALLYLEVSER